MTNQPTTISREGASPNSTGAMSEQLAADARTVEHADEYLRDLKSQVEAIFEPGAADVRGYITPSQEIHVRQLQFSYWKTRNALYELVFDIWRDIERLDRATPQQFLVAFAAASLLVDAARFLREKFHRSDVIRRKLDEPDIVHGIPPRMYDEVQKSLTSPYHAWHLWQATRYYDRHRDQFLESAKLHGLEPMISIIDQRRDRLRPSLPMYLRTRVKVRGRRAARRVGRDVLGRGVYALQEALGRGMARVSTRPRHAPSLPREIRARFIELLRPGDVLVVRKEFAASNYFLPGYWPHAALFLGTVDDLRQLGLSDDVHAGPRLSQLAAATPSTAVLHHDETNAWSAGRPHPCVLEAIKDGVRIRSVNSALNSDSVVLIRPLMEPADIAHALSHGLMHEGKPYDFDFDFCYSHRLVCTEVVYRAYEGVAGAQFDLRRHVGRFALAAGDLLRMALAGRHFTVQAAYVPTRSSHVEIGPAAAQIVRRVEGVTG
ncbi:MAG TPA: YiiX/YebB-like N1pC/P60 family cysteine hydrolase [Lacipirellulaceae bacterium]|nr:YiiX/YebB-like N1pC/P60 family cysteine hydrolase [Lacipirellulaceae bacterium]